MLSAAPRYYLETLGCQMNVADSAILAGILARAGYSRVESPHEADVALINTCAVRQRAVDRALARITEIAACKRRRPRMLLAVVGCGARLLGEQLAGSTPQIDIVAGPDSYRRLLDLFASARARHRRRPLLETATDNEETYCGLDPDLANGDHQANGFIAIQRGCNKKCSFCVVPFTRGSERSTPRTEILRRAHAIAAAGHKEITLLGQTVNSYRHGEVRFADLVRALAKTDGIERIRFTSPFPVDFTEEVIALYAEEPKVARHVHLPLQSGSDRVLERMARGYTMADYRSIVAALRRAAPGIAVTTDLMVGFPGESDSDYELTLAVMRELRFDSAFMFAYSQRARTSAAQTLADDVPEEMKLARLAEVIRLQETISAEANANRVGSIQRVLIAGSSKRSPQQLVGRTDTFKTVILPAGAGGLKPGDSVDVLIESSTSATLFGTPAHSPQLSTMCPRKDD
ncbi:MAG: tRNA (N6-isopentenyl adenosine(37)-C2)-methylthiotransferase MiaB [Pseudomonadota bacterium]